MQPKKTPNPRKPTDKTLTKSKPPTPQISIDGIIKRSLWCNFSPLDWNQASIQKLCPDNLLMTEMLKKYFKCCQWEVIGFSHILNVSNNGKWESTQQLRGQKRRPEKVRHLVWVLDD